jgi:hypothetical protein
VFGVQICAVIFEPSDLGLLSSDLSLFEFNLQIFLFDCPHILIVLTPALLSLLAHLAELSFIGTHDLFELSLCFGQLAIQILISLLQNFSLFVVESQLILELYDGLLLLLQFALHMGEDLALLGQLYIVFLNLQSSLFAQILNLLF